MSLRQAYARLGIATEPKTSGGSRLRHHLPPYLVHANRLVRALKRRPGQSGEEQADAYWRDLRALYEKLWPWFDSPAVRPTAFVRRKLMRGLGSPDPR